MSAEDFIGQSNFTWWFGVVENRIDPLNLGRCQVRCFGWHTEDINQIPLADLPWAHPIVPFGVSNIHPPTEGTMVFGFFADGKEGRYPILMGTVPGIPAELREPNAGFSDPWTEADKIAQAFPRKVKTSKVSVAAGGPTIQNDTAHRYPNNLNQPTTSKLARPDRVEVDGGYSGIRSESIANTTIDFQRKNRVTTVKSAKYTKVDAPLGKTATQYAQWDEPFPSYNAKYPFNNVTETESGHAFEMDDTPKFERVQLSHRTGSTLEFLPSGSVKQKTFNNKYDVTMGDHKSYVNGAKDETVQGNMFLRINGKLVVQCDGIELVSGGNIDIKGTNVNITASGNFNVSAGGGAKIQAGNLFECRGESGWTAYGGGAGAAIYSPTNVLMSGGLAAKVSGTNLHLVGGITWVDALITNILPPVVLPVQSTDPPKAATKLKNSVPKMSPTASTGRKEPTDAYSFREQQKAKINNAK